ncbi:MAG: replicative DNA helicase [Actinomycetes bacterium]
MTPESIADELAALERGAAPPHDVEAELSVLSAILLSERSLYGIVVGSQLKPEDFYRTQHAAVFAAMLELYHASEPIDTLLVKERLRKDNRLEEAGGEAFIDSLAAAAPLAANVRNYAAIVREKALLRRLLTSTYEIQRAVAENDFDAREIVERAEMAILEVARDDTQKDFVTAGDILRTEIDKLEKLASGERVRGGTPTGFYDLDALTGGFQPGNLIIIAARPSMGKSALVTNIAENAAIDHQIPVALFSLEMAEAELGQRFLASQAMIPGEKLQKGQVAKNSWSDVLDASNRIDGAPLYIDDTSDIGIMEVRAKARRLDQRLRNPDGTGGLGLIIVDYLQLMRADARITNRVEQVGQMSRGLKILARELEVPVIALSQLSRKVEDRGEKRPLLSDLRDSGQIEQDADLVMFIYRDEYYDPEGTQRPGEADLIIAKHRNGPLRDIPLTFQSKYPKFLNLTRRD